MYQLPPPCKHTKIPKVKPPKPPEPPPVRYVNEDRPLNLFAIDPLGAYILGVITASAMTYLALL